jgi:hypothetical protein
MTMLRSTKEKRQKFQRFHCALKYRDYKTTVSFLYTNIFYEENNLTRQLHCIRMLFHIG